MKILYVSTFDQPCGIATYTADLASSVQALGHEVWVLAEKTSPRNEKGTHCGIPYVRCWSRRRFKDAIVSAVETIKPDVVHIQHEHGLFPDDVQFKELLHGLDLACDIMPHVTAHTLSAKPALCGPLSGAAFWITHHPAGYGFLRAKSYSVEYIPHGVHEGRMRWGGNGPWLVPGFVSRSKRTHKIVEAWATAGRSRSLHVVGVCRDPGYSALLSRLCDATGAHWINEFASDEAMRGHYANAHAVVLGGPKKTAWSASGQVAQALAAGCPMFARNNEIYSTAERAAVYYSTWRELEQLFDWYSASDSMFLQEQEIPNIRASRLWSETAAAHVGYYEENL